MKLAYFSLGGTIASTLREGDGGVLPTLSGADLLLAADVGDSLAVEHVEFLRVPSTEITMGDIVRLHGCVRELVERGAQGVVISQGTDTIEEAAFLVDLLWDRIEPVVFTGAMRSASHSGGDGPSNLLSACRVACDPTARDCGVLTVFNDEIHCARFVRKSHTSSQAAFRSLTVGPIGWITENRPHIVFRPLRPPRLAPPDAALPPVAIVTLGLGDEGILLDAVDTLAVSGLVIEGFGGGHVRESHLATLTRLAARLPVVIASRTWSGEVLRETYGFPGGEIDLRQRQLIPSGHLDGKRARILLSLCLANAMDRPTISATFARYSA